MMDLGDFGEPALNADPKPEPESAGGANVSAFWGFLCVLASAWLLCALIGVDSERRLFSATDATREAIEKSLDHCAQSGDCLKSVGRGLDEKTSIDLSLLGAGSIPCLAQDCVMGEKNGKGEDAAMHLETRQSGQILVWAESPDTQQKQGYAYTPRWTRKAIEWEKSRIGRE